MTAAVRGALKGEVIPPGTGLALIVVPQVLDTWSLPPVHLRAGRTLAELAEIAGDLAGGGFRFRFAASIDDWPVAERFWRITKPKAGTTIQFRAVAEFGGDNSTLKTLLSAAVAVAGAFATAVNPLLGAAVTIGGQMAVNALFPPAAPVLGNDAISSPTYSISGGSNSADPFGVVPTILGRHRVYPKLGAKSYTEFVGPDQYLIMLLVWGYGPLDVSSIKIGETPIESFSDVEIETRQGYADDAPVTLYPSEVLEDDLDIALTVAAGAQQRTTAANIDAISVDAVAPAGIIRVDGNNATHTYTVQIRYDYAPTGTGVWTPIGTLSFAGRSRDPIRQGLRVNVPNGQYDVRATKISADYAGSDQVTEDVSWTAVRGFRNHAPLGFDKPLAVTALRIRANAQLTGVVDSLNGICASKVKAFDAATESWVADSISNQPADLFRHVLQGPANARPRADASIDIASLEAWAVFCAANGYAFNMVRDFAASVDDTLAAIAAAGRATVKRNSGTIGVIWDDPDAPVVQFFTPRNSWGFSGQRSYSKSPPQGFRVRFVNEDAGYAQDERIVYDDGYNADGSDGLVAATLFEGLEEPGITDSDLIWKFGRYHIAQARLRPETYTLNADLNSFAVSRGARVRVMSDVALWGLASGRVLSATVDGANDALVLDEPVTMVAGHSYTLRLWFADGSTATRDVVTDDGANSTIALAGHGQLPARDEQWSFGEDGKDSVVLRVLRVTPGPSLSAKLTLVDDAPEIGAADGGDIPAFDSQISIPVDPFTAAPVNLRVGEAFEGVDGASLTGALLTWETLAGEAPVRFETQYRDEDGDGVWRDGAGAIAPTKLAFFEGLLEGLWGFAVRCVFADGSTSDWARLEHQTITAGSGLVLPNVANVVTSYDDATATISWDIVKFSKLDVFYEVRKGDSWDGGLLYAASLAQPRFKIAGPGTYWISAKAQPLPGVTVYSAAPASIAIVGTIIERNILATLHEHADGWSGTISGPAVLDSGLIKTTATGDVAYYELAADRVFDLNFARRVRIDAGLKVVGVPINQNVLTDPDFLNNPDVLGASSAALVEAWIEIQVDGDVYALSDVFAAPDVFTTTAWQKYAPGEFEGRFVTLRAAWRSLSDSVYAALLEFDITADVADRIDTYTGLALPAAAPTTITFQPKGIGSAKPFKGGPDGVIGSDPHYQVTWNNTAGDELVVSAIDVTSMTLQIRNAGLPVDRIANIEVQGF